MELSVPAGESDPLILSASSGYAARTSALLISLDRIRNGNSLWSFAAGGSFISSPPTTSQTTLDRGIRLISTCTCLVTTGGGITDWSEYGDPHPGHIPPVFSPALLPQARHW